MKSKLLLSVVCWLLTASAWAQSSRWSIGLKLSSGWSGQSVSEQLDREVADKYQVKLTYAGGVRVGYRLSKRLSIVADAEWQCLRDSRVRTFNVLGLTDGLRPLIFTTAYNNTFERVQLPIQLQYRPLSKANSFYVSAGVMPSYLLTGRTTYTTVSTRTGELPSSSLTIFDVPSNEHLRRDLLFIAGLGTSLGKHLSVEALYQFNSTISYLSREPNQTFIGIPIYTSRANQGLLVSAIWSL